MSEARERLESSSIRAVSQLVDQRPMVAATWCTTRGNPALIQDFAPLDSAQPPRWLSSAVKLDSTSAIKKGWTGADVIRGRAVISSVFLSISGNGDKFIFR